VNILALTLSYLVIGIAVASVAPQALDGLVLRRSPRTAVRNDEATAAYVAGWPLVLAAVAVGLFVILAAWLVAALIAAPAAVRSMATKKATASPPEE